MPVASSRWTDDRLDDLAHRVNAMQSPMATVAVLEERMESLSRELRIHSQTQERISRQLGDLSLEPFKRGQAFRQALVVALCAALGGGSLAVLATFLSGAH